jgi:hypothetical protein
MLKTPFPFDLYDIYSRDESEKCQNDTFHSGAMWELAEQLPQWLLFEIIELIKP